MARDQGSGIRFVPFRARHLFSIKLETVLSDFDPLLTNSTNLEAMEIPGMSETCKEGSRIVGCAGILPQWPGRAIAWAVFGDVPRRAWPELTRRVLAVLDKSQANGTRRVETSVLHGFSAGHRWVQKMGFVAEAPMERYGPNGETYWLYARIR